MFDPTRDVNTIGQLEGEFPLSLLIDRNITCTYAHVDKRGLVSLWDEGEWSRREVEGPLECTEYIRLGGGPLLEVGELPELAENLLRLYRRHIRKEAKAAFQKACDKLSGK